MPVKMKDRQGRLVIYGRIKINGKQKSKRCQTMAEAYAWEAAARLDNPDLTQTDTVSIGAVANKYLDDVERRSHTGQVTRKHFSDCKRYVVRFVHDIGPAREAQTIKKIEVTAHLNNVAAEISPNTANVARNHIKMMMNWAFEELEFPRDWLRFPKRFKRLTPVKRPVFTKSEFWKLYDNAAPNIQVMLLAYLETAARKNELLSLEWKRVDLIGATITLRTGKRAGGVEDDVIPITQELAQALKELRLANMDQRFVFISNKTGLPYGKDAKVLYWLSKKSGVENKGFHALRRLSAQLDPETAYRRLRHQNKSTTDLYLQGLRRGEAVNIIDKAKKAQ